MNDLYTVIEILKKFYAVDTLEELVLAQDAHISSLQVNLCKPHVFVSTKVREG
jgi:hypothetical protein